MNFMNYVKIINLFGIDAILVIKYLNIIDIKSLMRQIDNKDIETKLLLDIKDRDLEIKNKENELLIKELKIKDLELKLMNKIN